MAQQQELKTFLQVRLPVDLAIKLRETAAKNMRSINNQIVFYLEKELVDDEERNSRKN